MKQHAIGLVALIIILAIIAGIAALFHPTVESGMTVKQPIADVTYACDGGKTIHALYYQRTSPSQSATAGGGVGRDSVSAPPAEEAARNPGFRGSEATATPAAPGMPPTPGGSVAITLSDGRAMTLPQTISADGARYANADESFIFWSKGNGAFVMEGNATTYANCVQQ